MKMRHPYQGAFDRRDPSTPAARTAYPKFIDAKRRSTTALLGPERPRPDTSGTPLSELLSQALGISTEEPIQHEPEPEASAGPSQEELDAFHAWHEKLFGEQDATAKRDFRPNGLCIDPKRAYRKQIAHEQRLLGKLKVALGEEPFDHIVNTQETHAAICYWLLSDSPERGVAVLAKAIATELGRPDLRWRIKREIGKIK
jgi:hypothetical protein